MMTVLPMALMFLMPKPDPETLKVVDLIFSPALFSSSYDCILFQFIVNLLVDINLSKIVKSTNTSLGARIDESYAFFGEVEPFFRV